MLDMGPAQGLSHLHPDHYVLHGNSVNYRIQSIPSVLPASGNSADLHLQFTDHYRTNFVYGSHFNGMQYHLSVSSNYVGEVAPANFYDPYMAAFSNGLVRSRSSAISFQPVPPFSCQCNYFIRRIQMDPSLQPPRNAFLIYSNQNYPDITTYIHGTCPNSGPSGVADMGTQGYQGNSSNRCTAFIMHQPSFSNSYQNYLPEQNLQVYVYSHHTQIPAAPYWHPFDNLHTNDVYPLRDDQRSDFRFVEPMPSTSGPMYIPLIFFEAFPGISYDPRNPPFDDAAEFMEAAESDDFEDAFDEYSDMRMDMDDISYEELMDLEENIGDVKSGFSEEFILKNLRTSMHVQQSTSSSLGSPSQSASENGICIVCQVEYEENEMIGTLDCGHSYHADCIKQWLAIKNICPLCKAPALVADKREG